MSIEQIQNNAHIEALRQQRNIAFDQAALLNSIIARLQTDLNESGEQLKVLAAKADSYAAEAESAAAQISSLRAELEELRDQYLLPTPPDQQLPPSAYQNCQRHESDAWDDSRVVTLRG